MKIIALLSIMLFSLQGFTQSISENHIPDKVVNAFVNKYPGIKNAHWEMHNKKQYEAEFKMDAVEFSAYFDESGNWLKTEQEINTKEIPAAVQTSLIREFTNFKIKESARGSGPDGMKYYALEIKHDHDYFDVSISHDGKIMMKQLTGSVKNDN